MPRSFAFYRLESGQFRPLNKAKHGALFERTVLRFEMFSSARLSRDQFLRSWRLAGRAGFWLWLERTRVIR